MRDLRLGIIGCGNMGSAIAGGVTSKGILSARSIFIYDKVGQKAYKLAKRTHAVKTNLTRVLASNIVIIAIKPQDFDNLAKEIAGNITNQIVVSIMAGVKIKRIASRLGLKLPIARVMPNIAAHISESTVCIAYNPFIGNKNKIADIFKGIGKVVEVDEKFMDTITALSGSGPAYLFYLADAMIDAGIKQGMDRNTAKKLVIQTLYGSSKLLLECGEDPLDMIKKVASKKGTTEAALKIFERRHLKNIIVEAIKKAKERSKELSLGGRK